MDNYNVVGDVAGQFLTLKALLAKMPQDAELLCLGDPVDRGPRSKEVVEFLMTNGKTVNSNHAHLMVEAWEQSAMPGAHPRYYEKGIWFQNGAIQTMTSYDSDWSTKIQFASYSEMYNTIVTYKEDKLHTIIPREHIQFLKNCPLYIESENFAMTHAPLHEKLTLEQACDLGSGFMDWRSDEASDRSLLWNRYVGNKPNPHLKGKINVFGHNSSDNAKVYTPSFPNGIKLKPDNFHSFDMSDVYAICLDTSSVKVLTGLHLPTMTLYQQEYID